MNGRLNLRCAARLLAATGLLCLCGGCATLFRGSTQTVKVVTDPPGAMVVVDGKTFIAPATVTVKRKKPHEVTVTKDGYQGVRFMFKGKWDAGGAGAVAADAIIPGGSVMFLVDTLIGADRQFSKLATIKLPPATQPATQPIVTLYEHNGQLLSKEQYDAAIEQEKWFAKNKKKKGAATEPATKP